MYTIKINVFEDKVYKDKENEVVFKESHYFEGKELKVESFEETEDVKLTETLVKRYPGVTTWIVNPNDNAPRMTIIGYFDGNNDYKFIAVFNPADIYIMQNGKTIDKINV